MTKVIKEGFEKFESSDESVACNTSLEVFHNEFNRLNKMDEDLFTYKVEIPELANIPRNLKEEDDLEQRMPHEYEDGLEYDPSNVEFIECWREDRYCNEGNLPGAYIVRNSLHYQDLEWYEALEDGELKEEALKNKAIMEGIIVEDDESSNEGRCELFDNHELPVCNIRKFEMIKYSFGDDEKYVAIKEDEYNDLTSTSKDACRIKIRGLPLYALGSNAYKKVAHMFGKFMFFEVEESTEMSSGTWNINIIDETLDSSNKLDVNGMEKVEDSVEENSLADLNDLNDLKETINELASNEIQHPICKENMNQKDDINKVYPKISVSLDLSRPLGIKRRRRDLYDDGVKNLAMASGCGRLKEI
ncbi:hypothetical protein Tco_0343777 [Tanacetum coccineum]